MSDSLSQDTLLVDPAKVGNLLTRMMEGDDDGLTVTEAELGSIKDDMEGRKATAMTSHGSFNIDTFSPRGEGTSGNVKVPELDVQTVSVIDHDEEHGGSDEDPRFYDPESNVSQINSGTESAPLLVQGSVTVDDFELLIESVNTMVKDEVSKIEQHLMVEIGKLNLEIGSLQKKVTSLSSKVTTLGVKVNEKPPALPITSTGPSGPLQPALTVPLPAKKGDKGKGKELGHIGKSPSITDIPGPGPLVATVVEYLARNPTYPKSALARRLRLQQLARELGFNVPTREVLPGDWTADGLLKLFV